VDNQQADLLEFHVVLAPVEHLVLHAPTVSAQVFVMGKLVQQHVQETQFVFFEFEVFIALIDLGQEVFLTVFVFADLGDQHGDFIANVFVL